MKTTMIDEKIKKQALELSHQDRAALVNFLIESLHPEKEIKSEEAWSNELKERIERYERGNSTSKSWNEISKNARSLLD